MSGLNKVMVIGHLGADPDVKQVGQNTVCKLSVATSEEWKDKDGVKQARTEWHRVIVWGKLAEVAGKFLAKGRQVYVEGKLQTRSWEDDKGQKKYMTEIIGSSLQFLGSNPNGNQGGGPVEHDRGPAPMGFDPEEQIPF